MSIGSKSRVLRFLGYLAVLSLLVIIIPQKSQGAVSVVPNSFQPDTVFREFPYTLSFTAVSDVPLGSVDSAFAVIQVLRSSDSLIIGTLFNSSVTHTSLSGDTLRYTGLSPQSISWPSSGTYAVRCNYTLHSGDSAYTIDTILTSALSVMAPIAITYQTGTLTPTTVEPGTQRSFSFDVISQAPYALLVDKSQSSLFLNGTSFIDTAALSFNYDSLLPALQTFTTANVTFPGGLPNDSLTTSATIAVIPAALAGQVVTPYQYLLSFGSAKVAVETVPDVTVQIVSLAVESPNSPKVNTGQQFVIHAKVANRSNFPIGPISFELTSDGQSSFTEKAVVQFIAANAEADLAIDVTADLFPSNGEIFRLSVASPDVVVLPAIDDIAFIIIEQPANLKFTASLFGAPTGVVGYGQAFSVNISLANIGDADAFETTYLLTTGDISLGTPDSIGGSIQPGQNITFNFRAPALDTQTVIIIKLLSHPIDANSGEPAPLDFDSLSFAITIRAPGGELLIEPEKTSYSVLTPGQLTDMFSLMVTNRVTVSSARIRLLTMTVDFGPIGNKEIDPAEFIDWTVSGIYRNDILISVPTPSGTRVIMALDGVSLSPQESTTLVIKLKLKPNAPSQFTFLQALSDVLAILVEGSTSRQAQVVTSMPSTFLFSESYAVVGKTLESSFIINTNPYDPTNGEALFAYQLESATEILFKLYSITGEIVLEKRYPEGDNHTSAGSHVIEWDGKNGEGDIVLNGVYIAVITNISSGESARIKVAVVR